MIFTREIRDMSAMRCCFLGLWPDRRQARRNASPMFLLGLPKNSLMQEWTTPAMRLTKTITWSCSTSVASVKFRMSQKPKIASTRRPGIMAISAELSPPFIFWPMISAPASPKPSAKREPILMMVFSSTTVSMGSGTCLFPGGPNRTRGLNFMSQLLQLFLWPRSRMMAACSFVRKAFRFFREAATCSLWCSSSPMVMASKGLFLIFSSLAIIRSMGISTSLFASWENVMAPKRSKPQMKIVCAEFSTASILEPLRLSKTNMNMSTSNSL
mmetsp:Transcript_52761/g.112926  ORF Transcript_52761/g.112926 Transcript_52761/m.112926 type:complete len:270 (+) Transcript_52761:848-1657(+)